MLVEIRCEHFTEKVITFHEGLNVVLGDDKATNSIGKSTLLMVIDFVFGGNTFISYNRDVVRQFGHHTYSYLFKFNKKPYCFMRSTETPDLVMVCNENFEIKEFISLEKYLSLLKSKYLNEDQNISFRSAVGLFARVWGKENLEVRKPLHVVQGAPAVDGVEVILRLFKKDKSYIEDQKKLQLKDKEFTSLKSALANKIIPKISQAKYIENEKLIIGNNNEIEKIKAELAKFAMNISELTNAETLELKNRKDDLLKLKLPLESNLRRIKSSLGENKKKISKGFERLQDFFPDLNVTKLEKIEEFHVGIKKILKKELETSKLILESDIEKINYQIDEIDRKLSSLLAKVKNPSYIIDRVSNINAEIKQAAQENEFFSKKQSLELSTGELSKKIEDDKDKEIKSLQNEINSKIMGIVTEIYGNDRKAPSLLLQSRAYEFKIKDDTGTGKAYANLIIFDLAIFELSNLPIIIHDSLLFKNIENSAVTKLVQRYDLKSKQAFISLDEIKKYGHVAEGILRQKRVIQLTEKSMLYLKDWRSSK